MGWILLAGYCAVFIVAIPLMIGFISPTVRRATLFAGLCGLIGAAIIVCVAVYLRGAPGLPPISVALFLFGASASAASWVAWLTYRIVAIFHRETPATATRNALKFLLLHAVKIALLFAVLDAFRIVGNVDFADEIPEIIFLRLHPIHYLYVGAATAIVFAWVFTSARRGPSCYVGTLRRAVVQVIPAAIVILLFLPVLMAWLRVALSMPLLDCSPRGIPGYVPDMIDYTLLVLDALFTGALVGLRSVVNWKIATCEPLATSSFAVWLVFVLNLTPITLLALLAHRFQSLRAARR